MPLSFAQQRMWFLQELAPGNPFYNIPAAVPLNGPLAVDALEAALNVIVERHESLRTIVGRINGQVCQSVRPHRHLPLDQLNLSSFSTVEAELRLDAIATAEAETPFDLAGPPIRFRLVRIAPARHVLLLTVHHIAADGWSMGILFRELSQLYEALSTGREPDLPVLRVQYADFAQWQRNRLSGATLDELLAYWRAKLAGARDLPLISDRPRPAVSNFRGNLLKVAIDRRTTDAMRKLARSHSCTLFQAMLAAFKAVLARFAGTVDVLVGAPIANRVHPEFEPLIGFFVNSLVLRTDLAGDPSFAEILRRVRETTLEAYAHQDLPFERLVEELSPERDLSRNPLFQVSFQIQNAPGIADQHATGGDDFRQIERSSAILDFAFSLWETADGLVGGVEYSTDLFDRESVQRIVDAVKLVAQVVAVDPAQRLSRLPIMDAGECARLERLLHGPRKAVHPAMMAGLFAQTANRFPSRAALIDGDGELSFAALDDLSARVARAFIEAGVRRGDIVGLALDRDRNFVTCMLAAARIGAAYLPIDPDVPPGRLQAMVEAVRPAIVILDDNGPAYPHGASGRASDLLAFAASCAPLEPETALRGEDPCYVLFTSGSTGRPKAVEVSHGALANHMHWMRRTFAVTPEDRVLQRTPTQFDASIWEFWLPLVTGATLCLPPPCPAADVGALNAAIEALRPTIVQCVPSLMPHLVAAGGLTSAREAIRLLCCGGEPLSSALVSDLREAFPMARIINLYGPTEATIDATSHEVPPDEQGQPPIGCAIDNGWALVVDEHGMLCPPNMRGEIAVGGAPLANGYLGQDRLTAERFVRLPANGLRAFLTGDIGWYGADGILHCAGRNDRQVKLRGNRIELGEIETVLEQHELVRRAALVLQEEHGEALLAAFLTLREGAPVEALRGVIEAETVGHWEGLYRLVYAGENSVPCDDGDDYTGWTSSFTGRPVPLDEMRRWSDETAARIRALHPRGIFEIGCGSGLILSRLAPDCERYVGCDISEPAIARLRARVVRNDIGKVTLAVAPAEEAAQLPIAGCDTLVLNSVVQYLPSAAHLRAVLATNAGRMPDDARLFIGDVRALGLMRAFHAAVELARAPENATRGDLCRRVGVACAQDKELLLDPAFFRKLAELEQRLHGDVAIRFKNGADDNELFAYRYDVTIRRGEPRSPAPLRWLNWRRGETHHERLRAAIEHYAGPVAIAGIPNLRVAQAVALSHILREGNEATSSTDLMREASSLVPDGLDPGAIAGLARAHGLVAEVLPSRHHPDRFDLALHDGLLDDYSVDAAQPGGRAGDPALSSEPTLRVMSARIAPELRAFLTKRLPPIMLPARITVLEGLPSLPSGKLDYVALTRHVSHEPVRETRFAVPGDALEQVVTGIFAAVLGATRVSTGDDFFADLGGHSLLATQAIARLREIFGEEVPLRLLFENPTPAALAHSLGKNHAAAHQIAEQFVAIQALDKAALDDLLAEPESVADG
nr:amino acid adenylation domain-containing protein [Rhizobium leguminosarum]